MNRLNRRCFYFKVFQKNKTIDLEGGTDDGEAFVSFILGNSHQTFLKKYVRYRWMKGGSLILKLTWST